MARHHYKTSGTCSTSIDFDLQDGKLHAVSFAGGCDGNLKALSLLVEGMNVDDLIKKLKGVRCGNKNTSCADQLVNAIAYAIERER